MLAERYNITHTTIQMESEREVYFKHTKK
jgi:Co/Zn/Cd efflux system component